jgi:hypothetical protein
MNEEEALAASVERAITPAVRKEMMIATVTVEDLDTVQFRFSPGAVFERAARIHRQWPEKPYIDLWQQYQPGESMRWLTGKPFGSSPGQLLMDLRGFCGLGDRREPRPHWRETAASRPPEFEHWIPAAGPRALGDARNLATACAADTGQAYFLWPSGENFVCASAPPPGGTVCSVNPYGEWSVHIGSRTVPVETPPEKMLRPQVPHDAVRLAAQDLGAGTGAPWRSAEKEAPPAARPAPARPARKGR